MYITVINLHKRKRHFAFLKLASLLLVITLIMSAIFTKQKSDYIYAMQILNEENLIIIDAGHGGEDPGAVGVGGVYEKDLNLSVAFALGEELTNAGFAVVYTRTEDKLMYNTAENIKGMRKIYDLKNRCKIAAEYPNAIFISIHMNSYGDSKYSGLQVYYSTENDESCILAREIQKSVKSSVQPSNTRVVKPGKGIYLLENNVNVSVLIECGFITNQRESEKLSEKEYQKQLSSAIVCGIIEYRNKISNT